MSRSSFSRISFLLILLSLSACEKLGISHAKKPNDEHGGGHGEEHGGGGHEGHHAHLITATKPIVMDVTSTQQYVCILHSRRHIEVRALETGYLEEIPVKEGQTVKQGDLLFKILPTLFQAKLDTEIAEAQLARIKYDNTKKLLEKNVVSEQELALSQAELNKALAKMALAQAEMNFTDVKAPFPGIIDRLMEQQGSLIEEGDILTTLSDNEVMWAYFNVPESRYLEYKSESSQETEQLKIQLMLANGKLFNEEGKIGAIEADFNTETGNIAFRADFANPNALLRHGQTGKILISRNVKDAIVIPQRATYEILAKRYVFVIDDQGVVHQRDIVIDKVLDDIFTIKEGVNVNEKIVLEGVQQVRDGQKIDFEYEAPEEVLSHLKYRAE